MLNLRFIALKMIKVIKSFAQPHVNQLKLISENNVRNSQNMSLKESVCDSFRDMSKLLQR